MEMSHKLIWKCNRDGNVTKMEMSLKWKYHKNENSTKMKMLQK